MNTKTIFKMERVEFFLVSLSINEQILISFWLFFLFNLKVNVFFLWINWWSWRREMRSEIFQKTVSGGFLGKLNEYGWTVEFKMRDSETRHWFSHFGRKNFKVNLYYWLILNGSSISIDFFWGFEWKF